MRRKTVQELESTKEMTGLVEQACLVAKDAAFNLRDFLVQIFLIDTERVDPEDPIGVDSPQVAERAIKIRRDGHAVLV